MSDHLASIAAVGPDYWWHQHRYELVLQALPPAPARLLDFGCGTGALLKWLETRLPSTELAGYDVDPATPSFASGGRARLIDAWPSRTAGFDAIVALDVLEHVDDDLACLESLAAGLSQTGTLVLTVPAHGLFWSSWDERLGHRRRYERAGLTRLIEAAGLVPARVTEAFSFLVGPALARRLRGGPSEGAAEFRPLPVWVNAALARVCAAERRLLKAVDLPFGTSLLAVARKP